MQAKNRLQILGSCHTNMLSHTCHKYCEKYEYTTYIKNIIMYLLVLAWQQTGMSFLCKVVSECSQHHDAKKDKMMVNYFITDSHQLYRQGKNTVILQKVCNAHTVKPVLSGHPWGML